jgi:hypothetical protein
MRPPVAEEPGRSLLIHNYINHFPVDSRMPSVLVGNSIQSRFISNSPVLHLLLLRMRFLFEGAFSVFAVKVVKAMVTDRENQVAAPSSSNCFARIY